jgi:hypothetical protein
MKKRIVLSEGKEDAKRKEEQAFLKLTDDQRFRIACELSEIALRIQFENGVLPKDNNFTLIRE